MLLPLPEAKDRVGAQTMIKLLIPTDVQLFGSCKQ